MVWPVYTVKDLARYAGRPEASYSDFTEEALDQATFLFQLATQLVDFPTVPADVKLARLGILSMADSMVLYQPYQSASVSPFQSESIGSYHYSRGSAANAMSHVNDGTPTGVFWFDLAVSRLGVGEANVIDSEAVTVFENDFPSQVIAGRRMVGTLRRDALAHDPNLTGYSMGNSALGLGSDGSYATGLVSVGPSGAAGAPGAPGAPGDPGAAGAPGDDSSVGYGGGVYLTTAELVTVPAAADETYAVPFDTSEDLTGNGGVSHLAGWVTVGVTGYYHVLFTVTFDPGEDIEASVALMLAVDPPTGSYPTFTTGALPAATRVDSVATAADQALLFAGNQFYLNVQPVGGDATVLLAELTIQRVG